MSKIEEYFSIEDTVSYYRKNRQDAIAVVEQANIPSDCLMDEADEASRQDALSLACAIIALTS